MVQIIIRRYRPEDHKDVNRVFSKSMTDIQHVKNGILIEWQSPYVISFFIFLFLFGYYFSITFGIFSLMIGMLFSATCMFAHYHLYVWWVILLIIFYLRTFFVITKYPYMYLVVVGLWPAARLTVPVPTLLILSALEVFDTFLMDFKVFLMYFSIL